MKAIGSHAYRFEVPEGTRWHNVVHTTLLKPFTRWDEPQDMDEDEAEIWEVEEIVNSRTLKGVVQHRLRWAGCTEFEDTWETIDHLNNCPCKLKKFRQTMYRKPRDEKEVWLRPQASDKQLPIESPSTGAVTWYLLRFLRVAFSYGFFGERLGF